MEHMKLTELISQEKIEKRVNEIGRQLSEKFKDKDVVAVCILKGSFMFYADLIRALDIDLACDFFGVSSYQGNSSSGEVKLTLDLSKPVHDKHVILIEDIVDTGLTMQYLQKALLARNPKSLTTTTLLLKPSALRCKVKLDVVGFEISDQFVVGYGLDYQGHYRNLPYIAQVQDIN